VFVLGFWSVFLSAKLIIKLWVNFHSFMELTGLDRKQLIRFWRVI